MAVSRIGVADEAVAATRMRVATRRLLWLAVACDMLDQWRAVAVAVTVCNCGCGGEELWLWWSVAVVVCGCGGL